MTGKPYAEKPLAGFGAQNGEGKGVARAAGGGACGAV